MVSLRCELILSELILDRVKAEGTSGMRLTIQIEGPLGLDNKLVGYVFLIDQNLKVRWAGCGPATEEEVESLRKGAAVLMKRASE